jgi:mitochondrial fission protein ELM1
MENQCRGLAEALKLDPVLKRVRAKFPWKYLPVQLWWRPLTVATKGNFVLPWPDILISCGRRSVAAAMAVRRMSAGKTFTIHIQDPHVAPCHFDIVVVPQHDDLRGDNVLVTRGALHRVTAERLEEAACYLSPELAHLPRPLVAVLVGGSNQRQMLSSAMVADLSDKLAALCRGYGASLAITPSRRTGANNEKMLRQRLQDLPTVIWDGRGANPYFGYLGLADAIVVTSDSVSMVSEACATGKPVYVYPLGDEGTRLRRFHQRLCQAGITRPFTGNLEQWSYPPLDDTLQVAATIRQRFARRLISS